MAFALNQVFLNSLPVFQITDHKGENSEVSCPLLITHQLSYSDICCCATFSLRNYCCPQQQPQKQMLDLVWWHAFKKT